MDRGMTRRGTLAGAGLGVAGAALAACAPGGGAGGDGPPAASRGPVTLSFLSWRPPAMDQFAPFWQEYGKKNNVTIEVDKTGDYQQQKLTTMFASDTGPDLFDSEFQSLARMYDSKFVLELDKYITRDKINLDRDWAILGIERWRGKTYGVPYWVEPFGIYYNKTLFKAKGIEDPWVRTRNQGDWTMEEMVEAARKINDPANDVWGLDWGTGDMYGIGPLIWTQGATHFQYDPKIEFTLQGQPVLDANTWAIDWGMRQKLNVAAPTPEAGASRERIQGGRPGIGGGGINRFSQGKIGIHYRSVNDWRRMWPIVGTAFEWDMLPVPSIKGKPGAGWAAGHPVCAYSKTKNPEAAWNFMRYMIQDDFQGVLAEQQFLVPAKKAHQTKFYRPTPQYPYQHPQVFANVFKRPYGIQLAHYNAFKNLETYGREMDRMVKGEVPLQGGLRELERLLNQDIDYGGGDNPFKGVKLPLQPK